MRRLSLIFSIIIVIGAFLGSEPVFSAPPDPLCAVENNPTVDYGGSVNVEVTETGTSYAAQTDWHLSMRKAGGTFQSVGSSQRGLLPKLFTIANLYPGMYDFQAEGKNRGVIVAVCTSSAPTEVRCTYTKPWFIKYFSWPLTGPPQCYNGCEQNPPTSGDYATRDACLAALPVSPTPVPTNTPAPPPGQVCPGGKCETAVGWINTNVAGFIGSLLTIILGGASGIAFILIIYSGFKIIISQGNPEAVQGARETLTSAIVGFLFIIFAIFLLQLISVDILAIPGFRK